MINVVVHRTMGVWIKRVTVECVIVLRSYNNGEALVAYSYSNRRPSKKTVQWSWRQKMTVDMIIITLMWGFDAFRTWCGQKQQKIEYH